MNSLGFSLKEGASLRTLTMDVVKSSEIEGEKLNFDQVRSSIARRLGLNIGGLITSDRNVEGVVEMMLDATQNYLLPLTNERIFGWHAALFPTGWSGIYKIEVGQYRAGKMQIVSVAMGNETIHFEAPKAQIVPSEMNVFLEWLADEKVKLDPVLKAAIAHFWFITIHPLEDGNGRIARAISDMLLAQADKSSERYYSLSSQILIERIKYYEVLQKLQHSDGDITEWLCWFLNCLKNALLETEGTVQKILYKSKFWHIHENTLINERQRLMLNKLLMDFEGKLKTSKWAKMTKCSTDTALRDIKDLIEKDIIQQEIEAGGRNTNYELKGF